MPQDKSKCADELSASALWFSKFVLECAALHHELRKPGTSAADLKFLHRVPRVPLRNFKSKSGTRIIELLVPFGFRSSYLSVPRCITNFENRALGVRQEEERMP
jgi:hypothetical protein